MTSLDPRLHAYRPDLADIRLQRRVEAGRFVEGRPMRIAVPAADMRAGPAADSGVNSQLVFGDPVLLFETGGDTAWVQAVEDDYVGYVRSSDLAEPDAGPTHHVVVPRTFAYPGPELKAPATRTLSMGSRVRVVGHAETRGTHYALLASGEALIAAHLLAIDEWLPDFVTVAEMFGHTPYLWGGTSGFGLDCSGLIQLAMRMAGRVVLRDSDMQAETIGTPVEPGGDHAGLRRGDLVFWKGHVGIVCAPGQMIHASGHQMMVVKEPLAEAVARIRRVYAEPTGFRRP
ncbi:C40 family peptidase [Mesorhizobium xinjiangense]|uniref:C40 family peptidase n=1 Tax=Mesorhizobium xinjiangense TaxID=2678685 RepID=UPI0012EDB865|nr:NlpC/P60 family protein [Mesorhizobium xinjiangense]